MIGNAKVEYSYDGLKRLIGEYEAISFDIFDTLVMRTVYFNRDVFRIVAQKYQKEVPNFYELRVEAEYNLSRTRYPYMEEIYAYIAKECGIDQALATEIMHYEIEVETQVIVPRKEMVEIFNYSKQIGKRVYIVSDMYMHKEDLERIINNIGIVDYDKILVSCEYDTSKPQRLFECYKQEVPADSYLHIGDSFACDIAPSAKLGIDSFRLKMSSEIWEEAGNKPSEELETRTEQAQYIAKELNSPFSIEKCN